MLDGLSKFKFSKNPFILFAPFLLFYIGLVICFPTHGRTGDEGRYLIYAQYMYNGFLPPTEAGIDILGNGPGYSIILMPFVLLHLPLIWITLLNAFLYYLSIILLFKTSLLIGSFRKAFLLSLFWACYYNSYENMVLILPEVFIAFLICLLMFFIIKAFSEIKLKKQYIFIFFSGIILGYIAITKPIFGYVLLVILIGAGILWLIKKDSANYKKVVLISLLSLISTIPYLIYTYKSTGKLYYWSTFGGNNLYWMSSPIEDEYGSWLPDPKPSSDSSTSADSGNGVGIKSARDCDDYASYDHLIFLRHQKDFKKISLLSGVERDDAYKKIAIKNIKSNPAKFLKNCLSNIGRIFFNFPFSYKLQHPSTLLRLPLSGTLLFLTVFSLFPTFINWKKLIFPIRFMVFFAFLYLGGSVFASAESRMLTPIVPILLFWISFVIQKSLKINYQWK
jgi:hypothetical protein